MPLISGLKNLLSNNKGNQSPTSPTSNSTTIKSNSKSSPSNNNNNNNNNNSNNIRNSIIIETNPQQIQQQTQSQQQPTSNLTSPTSTVTTPMSATTSNANKEAAEELVRRENEAKLKRDQITYIGLPEGLTLGKKMGDGAFSNVFMATLKPPSHQLIIDPTLGKSVKVAVKCVRKFELSYSQGLAGKRVGEVVKKKPRVTERANILKEVQIMRGLDHPSIVKLLNFSESEEHYYLTLELMGGGELFHQIVKLTYFSEELSRHVILQVAHGIRYLHNVQGVVHRDIKPENILFESIPIIPSKHPKLRPYDEEKEDEGEFIPSVGGGGIGRVKIADFGLSKIVWNEDTMTPCGTVGYTAPEIVKDERYTTSVDMWALGCVLYTLLCGFPPFYDESINVLTEKVAKGYYTFLSPWWDDISASSKDLISHLLEVNPDKRYTIDEFLAHPWCNEQPTASLMTPARLDSLNLPTIPKQYLQPLDSPLLSINGGLGRRAMPSPGISTLKEVFDVSNAINRMEEEGNKRRAYNGPGGTGRRGFLAGLNEEEDDEIDEQEEVDLELSKRRYGKEVSKAIEDKRRLVQNLDPSQTKSTAEEEEANATYQGWGGADRKLAEAALYDGGRAGPRDRGGRSKKVGGFELTLDKATLLGKRRKDPITSINPGSPMRVD